MARSSSPCDAPQLVLRPWTLADAAGLREAIDDDLSHLQPWLTWTLDEPATLEQTRARIADYMEQYRSGLAFRHAITPADRPAVILGAANVYARLGPAAREIGYWVRASAARKGIATAAVSILVVEAFRVPAVRRLVIRCDVANRASAAFAENLGFQRAAASETSYPDGSPRAVLEFTLVHDDFRQLEARFHARASRAQFTGHLP